MAMIANKRLISSERLLVDRRSHRRPRRHGNNYGCTLVVSFLLVLATASAAAQTVSLDGEWHFVPDRAGSLSVDSLTSLPNARVTHVPGSWQEQFSDLRDYAGIAWYWRTVNAGSLPNHKRAWLRFDAVDYRSTVYVNGKRAGTHDGGYLPFEIDVTPFWRRGLNRIALQVVDPGADRSVVEGIDYAQIPHGKQNWYVQTSGPWQSVKLEYKPEARVLWAHVTARADGSFRVQVRTSGAGRTGLAMYISDHAGREVWKQREQVRNDEVLHDGRLTAPRLWSPEHPSLYSLRVELDSGDSLVSRFGFRTMEAHNGKLYLNGRPLYLRGALDQNFYPETIYRIPSSAYVLHEMKQAKEIGFNALRFHIKAADPRYLDAADEIGLLIWYDLPNWDRLTPDSKTRGLHTLQGIIERDWNHPSIVIYTVINEAWGVDMKNAADRQWVKDTWHYAKEHAPGWLVVDNSPCCDNYHLKTDIADFHQYNAIPDFAASFESVIDEFAGRPKWLFSQNGDAEETGHEPLILSEFGNWGLPLLPSPAPWWFRREFKSNDITLPAGIETRFTEYGFATVFGTMDELIRQTQQHQWVSLKYEIDSLRSHPEIQGYVITEFTDVNWEANGVLDMWRRPKAFAPELAALQRDDGIVIRCRRRNYITGDRIAVELVVSHYGETDWTGAQLEWSLETSELSGRRSLIPAPPGSGHSAGWLDLVAPNVTAPQPKRLHVRVALRGKTLCENWLDLFFFPRNIPDEPPAVQYYDPAHELSRLQEAMAFRNYHAAANRVPAVVIATRLDEELRQQLKGGATVILLPSTGFSITDRTRVVVRANSNLDGNWISGFLWTRKNSPVFHAISFQPLAGFEAKDASPRSVIIGVPASSFSDVLSGVFYGWLQSNVATVVQGSFGKGKLIVCTFDLADSYGSDPYATYLLDELISYASTDFSPRFAFVK